MKHSPVQLETILWRPPSDQSKVY